MAADSAELVYFCRGDRGGNPIELKRLLDHGATVDFQDHKGKTAIHRAAKAGFVEAMKVLLKYDAAMNVEDSNGETPLFEVVRSTIKNTNNKKKALGILLKAGADQNHTNRKGQTPLSIAEKGRHKDKDLANLLKRAP